MGWLNINTGVIGMFLMLATWAYFSHNPETIKINPLSLPWVPIDVRKNKVYVSMTKDASMYTERARRVAIIGGPDRFGRDKSSLNGYLEAGLTSICKAVFDKDIIFDAGEAVDEYCDILDDSGDGIVYDAGNENTLVCGV